jgi:flagellar basal-body rod protein FlgB
MIDALFSQPTYVASKKMLDATALRHEAIASNIANIETPNYKRVDLAPSFEMELKQAIFSGDNQKVQSLSPAISQDPDAVSFRRDGNNVQLEDEMMNLSQNTVAHALETQLVTMNLLHLQTAISGKPA